MFYKKIITSIIFCGALIQGAHAMESDSDSDDVGDLWWGIKIEGAPSLQVQVKDYDVDVSVPETTGLNGLIRADRVKIKCLKDLEADIISQQFLKIYSKEFLVNGNRYDCLPLTLPCAFTTFQFCFNDPKTNLMNSMSEQIRTLPVNNSPKEKSVLQTKKETLSPDILAELDKLFYLQNSKTALPVTKLPQQPVSSKKEANTFSAIDQVEIFYGDTRKYDNFFPKIADLIGKIKERFSGIKLFNQSTSNIFRWNFAHGFTVSWNRDIYPIEGFRLQEFSTNLSCYSQAHEINRQKEMLVGYIKYYNAANNEIGQYEHTLSCCVDSNRDRYLRIESSHFLNQRKCPDYLLSLYIGGGISTDF